MNFKILKESLINCPALGCSNYQLPFFLFVYEKEENVLGVLTQKHEDNHQPIGYYSQQVDIPTLPQSYTSYCSSCKGNWGNSHDIIPNHPCATRWWSSQLQLHSSFKNPSHFPWNSPVVPLTSLLPTVITLTLLLLSPPLPTKPWITA